MMTKKMRYPSLIHYTYTKDTHVHTPRHTTYRTSIKRTRKKASFLLLNKSILKPRTVSKRFFACFLLNKNKNTRNMFNVGPTLL
jgi:hypothetical protein